MDVLDLGKVQKRPNDLKRLEHFPYRERLKYLGLLRSEKREGQRRDMIAVCKMIVYCVEEMTRQTLSRHHWSAVDLEQTEENNTPFIPGMIDLWKPLPWDGVVASAAFGGAGL